MTMARSRLVDPSVTRWYHCMTRCVRGADLLAKRRRIARLGSNSGCKNLHEIFAVGVGGFSVMDNHLHVLLRLDPDVASGWSDEEVVRRWGRLVPPRDKEVRPRSIAGRLLRVEPSPPAGGCQAVGRPSRGQPERVPGAMRQRSAGGSQQPADLSTRSFTSPKNRDRAPVIIR